MQRKFNTEAKNDVAIVEQCEALKHIIEKSFTDYGAHIEIVVRRDDGDVVETKLYDDAIVVEALHDAMQYIIDNLS